MVERDAARSEPPQTCAATNVGPVLIHRSPALVAAAAAAAAAATFAALNKPRAHPWRVCHVGNWKESLRW